MAESRKGGLALLVLQKARRGSDPRDELSMDQAGDGGSQDDLESVAEDLINAVKDGDAKGVAEALSAAYSICDDEGRDEGDQEG